MIGWACTWLRVLEGGQHPRGDFYFLFLKSIIGLLWIFEDENSSRTHPAGGKLFLFPPINIFRTCPDLAANVQMFGEGGDRFKAERGMFDSQIFLHPFPPLLSATVQKKLCC